MTRPVQITTLVVVRGAGSIRQMSSRSLPLGIAAVVRRMEEMAKDFHGRVDWKINAKGELVIAMILPPEDAPDVVAPERKKRGD